MSVKQDIYNVFIQSGMTQEAALGTEANLQAESGLEANRVEGDFSSFRTLSKSYVQRIKSNEIDRDGFARHGRGFGLAQWTYYTRRYALWDFWKQSGREIDDPVMQAQFVVAEMKKDYRNLWTELCRQGNDLYTCTKLVCTEYERPAHNNIDQRYVIAVALKAELVGNPSETTKPDPVPAAEVFWPPRMICKGMEGSDVAVLQAVLTARGYNCDISGKFDVKTHNMTIAFQSQNGLSQDGIAGPLTWSAVLERR